MNRILIITISFLIVFAWWSALTIGLSTDEFFHHINGSKRYNFLTSFGADKNFQLRNNQFYPGLYDTFSYAIGQIILLINKKIRKPRKTDQDQMNKSGLDLDSGI